MSIAKLIEITNSSEYLLNCDLELKNITINYNQKELIFHYFIKCDSTNEIQEWELKVNGCKYLHKIFNRVYLPYISLSIEKSHPILWKFNEKLLRFSMTNYPLDDTKFIGDLYNMFDSISGNWILMQDYFYSVQNNFKKSNSLSIVLPKQFKISLIEICNIHNIKLNIKDENHLRKSRNKTLIFGNERIVANSYNLGQPYIVAESFKAQKIK